MIMDASTDSTMLHAKFYGVWIPYGLTTILLSATPVDTARITTLCWVFLFAYFAMFMFYGLFFSIMSTRSSWSGVFLWPYCVAAFQGLVRVFRTCECCCTFGSKGLPCCSCRGCCCPQSACSRARSCASSGRAAHVGADRLGDPLLHLALQPRAAIQRLNEPVHVGHDVFVGRVRPAADATQSRPAAQLARRPRQIRLRGAGGGDGRGAHRRNEPGRGMQYCRPQILRLTRVRHHHGRPRVQHRLRRHARAYEAHAARQHRRLR